MIQRIQTIYLSIATVLTLVMLLLKVQLVYVTAQAGEYFLTPFSINLVGANGTETVVSALAIAAILSLGLLLTIFAIMQFKKRKLQIKVAQGALLLQLAAIAAIFYYVNEMSKIAEFVPVSYSPILIILLINVVVYFLAIRGIKKDDKLVRSADRLR
tara:strand:- start:120 stop:590 length:471 start_codon:yes stop_codon:yes gene_type:complete